MTHDLKIRCDAPECRRGIVPGPAPFTDEWARPCPVCRGRGSISLESLCRRIGECETTVSKLFKPHRRMRVRVAARICGKIADLVAPAAKIKQQEMFT